MDGWDVVPAQLPEEECDRDEVIRYELHRGEPLPLTMDVCTAAPSTMTALQVPFIML